MVTLGSTRFKAQKLYILHTECICAFCAVVRQNYNFA